MILDELKTAWQVYDRKLQLTQTINEKILRNMIRERSSSRVAKIRREYLLSFFYMFTMFLLFLSVFIWNPFDFTHLLQYTPTLLQSACMLVVLIVLAKGYVDLDLDMNQRNLDMSIKKTITIYEKSEKVLGWAGASLMVSGLLFPLAFLPRTIKSSGIWQGLGVILIQIGIVLVLYIIAAKLGFLRDRKKHANKFKEDLNDLEELKSMSEELHS